MSGDSGEISFHDALLMTTGLITRYAVTLVSACSKRHSIQMFDCHVQFRQNGFSFNIPIRQPDVRVKRHSRCSPARAASVFTVRINARETQTAVKRKRAFQIKFPREMYARILPGDARPHLFHRPGIIPRSITIQSPRSGAASTSPYVMHGPPEKYSRNKMAV